MVEIRPERPGEAVAIEHVHRQAFGRDAESRLVRRLRAEGYNVTSMVAADGASIIGHALFSRVSASGPRHLETVALAPVAVLPNRQRIGIGSEMIRVGLDACRASAVDVALVLGDPGYYTRFGFDARLGSRFRTPWTGLEFLAIELQPGVLGDSSFDVEYPSAFQEV